MPETKNVAKENFNIDCLNLFTIVNNSCMAEILKKQQNKTYGIIKLDLIKRYIANCVSAETFIFIFRHWLCFYCDDNQSGAQVNIQPIFSAHLVAFDF